VKVRVAGLTVALAVFDEATLTVTFPDGRWVSLTKAVAGVTSPSVTDTPAVLTSRFKTSLSMMVTGKVTVVGTPLALTVTFAVSSLVSASLAAVRVTSCGTEKLLALKVIDDGVTPSLLGLPDPTATVTVPDGRNA